MKTMQSEFDALVKSFRGTELDSFAEQLIGVVLCNLPDAPGNNNQTIADRCKSLLAGVDLTAEVRKIVTARLNAN